MARIIYSGKFWVVAVLCMMLIASGADVFARDRDEGRDNGHRKEEIVNYGPQKYHYRDGRFYRQGLFGLFDTIVAPPPGVVVRVIPETRRVMIVDGATYYYYDDVYYTSCPDGYVVVQAPRQEVKVVEVARISEPVTALDGEPVTVNIPNSDGTYTPVKLFKHGNGYKGPQGEFYEGHPTVAQLKALYGK
ncbi:MAG: DUF6515 family protein [Dehalococcoidales bacterium]|jgi:hypothetical protein